MLSLFSIFNFIDLFKFSFGADSGDGASSTTYTSNIPEWMKGDQKGLWEATKRQLFDVDDQGNILRVKPYVPYSGNPEDYIAKFTKLQEQALSGVANLQVPKEFQQAADIATTATKGALDSANRAYGYGQQAADYGKQGAGYGQQAADYGKQGLTYGQQAADYGKQGSTYGQQAADYGKQGITYGQQAADYGKQGLTYGQQAAGYGQKAAELGALGLQERAMASNVASQSQDLARRQAAAGDLYAKQATDQGVVSQYMSPYVQNVINQQKEAAIRDYNIQKTQRQASAARSGAYGGSRQAIQEAEAERALNSQLQNIQAQGLQSAYDKAIQSLQYGSGAGIQGLAGAQSGLNTALSGGQLGLQGIQSGIQGAQAGMQGAQAGMQGVQTGIQGAQAGMQGVQTGIQGAQTGMQGAQTGIQGAQAGMQGVQTGIQGAQTGMQGAQTGIQGAQAGLQGVAGAQAGYTSGLQGAGQLANIGQEKTQTAMNILEAQSKAGAMEQQQDQNVINQAIKNFGTAQAFPQEQLGYMANLLSGAPSPGTSVQLYQGAPSLIGTAGALGTAAIGAKQAGLFKEGGIVNLARGGAIMGYADGGDVTDIDNVERIAQDLSLPQLQQSIQNKTIPEYIGIPLLAQKQQEQQRMQMAQAAQQAPQGIATIKDKIMQGVDTLPTNLYPQDTVTAAGGGIIAFAAGGDVPRYGVGGVPSYPLTPNDLQKYDLTPYEGMYKETLNPATRKPYTEEEIYEQQAKKRESRGIKDIYGEETKDVEDRLKKLPAEEKEMMGYAIMSGAFEAMAEGSPNAARYLGNLGSKVSKNAAGVKREFKALAREARKEKQALKIAQDQAARADLAGDQAAFERNEQKRQASLGRLADIKTKVVDQANDVLSKGKAAEYDLLGKIILQDMENSAKITASMKDKGLELAKLRNAIYTNTISQFEKEYGTDAVRTKFRGDQKAADARLKEMFADNFRQALGILGEESDAAPAAAPNVVQPKVDMKIPTIKTRAEYNKLKPGTRYIDPTNTVRTKQ